MYSRVGRAQRGGEGSLRDEHHTNGHEDQRVGSDPSIARPQSREPAEGLCTGRAERERTRWGQEVRAGGEGGGCGWDVKVGYEGGREDA